MRAIIYKGLETKPSEEIKLKEGKLAPQLKHLGDHLAISGGQKCGKNYCVKKNDIITVRVYAGAPVAIVIAIIAVPFVVVGIVKLVNLYQDLKKLSQRKTINRKVESLPYLGGAENQLATGQTQPMIIGEHLFTPYFIDYPLSRISGTDGRDQFTYRVYELGFKEQVIKEIKAGKASLKKFSLSEPQEGKFNLDATSSLYDADAFFEITQGGEFLTEEFNKKYYHLESGAILPKKKDGVQGELNFELPANSRYIEVAILFNGLVGYRDDGSKTSRSVEVKPQYSLDGTTWTTFAFDGATNNVFTRITQEQIRFTARKTFTYAEIKNQTEIIKVRLLCPTVDNTQQGYDDCYCVYVQAELFNVEDSKKQNKFVAEKRLPDKQRALSTRLGLKIKATEDNQDKLGQINVITQGVAPTPAGNWINKTPTSNPASWLYEILTSETHPLSAISKDEIDLASFTELYDYCKDEGLEVNAVLLEARPKQQVLEMVLRLCNSVLYRNMTGQLQVATDKLNSQPIALFTSQNVLSTTIDKNLERKTDGVLINYIDSSLGYEQASHLVMQQGETETPDSVISTVQTEGITHHEQIVKFGRRLLATENLRPKTVKVQTSLEGVFYTPMSKALLQTETLKTGKGNGEVKKVILDDNDLITHLELYDKFEFTENETNIIVVSMTRLDGNFTHTVANFEIASAEGKKIELATPISSSHANAPKKGDTLAYGVATEPVISEMIIAGVEENANGYTLTLVDYNEAIYDSGEIPEYKPSWASDIGDKPPATLPPLTFGDLETYVELEAPDTPTITAIAQKDSLKLSATVQDGAKNGIAKIEWSLKKDNAYELIGISRTDEFVYDLDDYYEVEDFATWRVKARVFNANGKGTESLPVTINTDTYGTWNVLPPDAIYVQSANRAANVTWQRKDKTPLGKDIYGISFFDIQISKDGTNWYKPAQGKTGKVSEDDWKDGTGFLRLSGGSWSQSLPLTGQTQNLPENTTYYYRVRTRGITDTYISAWSDAVTAIALATGTGDIIAKTVKEAQLDDSSVSNIKIKDGSIVASEKVVANSISTELLNVLAKNKINNFSITGTLEGWSTTGTLEDDASGFKKLRFDGYIASNVFTVQPNEICSFEFGIACPNYTSLSGMFVGLTWGQSFRQYQWSFVTNKWTAGTIGTNQYFIESYKATTVKYFKTYILGSNVDINDIPAPSATDATYRLYALQLQGSDTTAKLRTGVNSITPGTYWELYLPQVYSGQGGKIVAQQIITPALSAINANVGEITSGILRANIKAGESKPNVFLDLDTEEFRVGNNPSLQDSNHADAEYLHWKPNQGLFLKLKNLIVDAIASTIRGRFRVRGTTATMAQSVLIVNPESTVDPETNTPANTTDIKTALRCTSGTAISPAATSGYVLIGNPSGNHIAIDNNEIQSKANGATAGKLWLNDFGGDVDIGSAGYDVRVKGNLYGNLTGNATTASKANVRVSLRHGTTWFSKTWSGLTNFSGNHVWTDGENIYYSSTTNQYVLNKASSTWSVKTWNGLTNFYGRYVWSDGENIYYSWETNQYVLNKASSTWSVKTWNGLTAFYGRYVWTDGDNIYYSSGTEQYVLNKANSTWSSKTWTGLTDFDGYHVWTDGENIYYSEGTKQYVLNKASSTLSVKTWNGLTNFYGYHVWTDGENIYYSFEVTNYVLNKTSSTWTAKSWNGLTNFDGFTIWTDGENIYYSYDGTNYVLPATRHNYVDDNKYQGLFGVSTSCNPKTLSKDFVFSNE